MSDIAARYPVALACHGCGCGLPAAAESPYCSRACKAAAGAAVDLGVVREIPTAWRVAAGRPAPHRTRKATARRAT